MAVPPSKCPVRTEQALPALTASEWDARPVRCDAMGDYSAAAAVTAKFFGSALTRPFRLAPEAAPLEFSGSARKPGLERFTF